MKTIIKRILLVAIVLVVFLGALEACRRIWPNETIVMVDRPVILDNLSEKVNEFKGRLMADLKKCESGNSTEDDGLIIWDTNNKPSIGGYMFQKATVIHYYKTLYGLDITGKDAIIIALDDDKAGELASKIIFTTDNGLSNWANCTRKVGLEQQLTVIKQLEK